MESSLRCWPVSAERPLRPCDPKGLGDGYTSLAPKRWAEGRGFGIFAKLMAWKIPQHFRRVCLEKKPWTFFVVPVRLVGKSVVCFLGFHAQQADNQAELHSETATSNLSFLLGCSTANVTKLYIFVELDPPQKNS